MKVLVTGAAGLLGRALAACLESEGPVIGLAHSELDISSEAAVSEALSLHQPVSYTHLTLPTILRV